MNCPVCNKPLASTLSICPGCGTMMHDSVREELEIKSFSAVKIIPTAKSAVISERKEIPSMPSQSNQFKLEDTPKPAFASAATGEIAVKTTVPTLVEFQSKNTSIPDWRLKMQNAVRQRLDVQSVAATTSQIETPAPVHQTRLVTSGANALKAEIFEETTPYVNESDPVARALKRIEDSRRTYFIEESLTESAAAASNGSNKNFPFTIAPKSNDVAERPLETRASVNVIPKPKLVSTPARNLSGDLDTNKLPKLSPHNVEVNIDALPTISAKTKLPAVGDLKAEAIHITPHSIEELPDAAVEVEEGEDDLAPFAMRFNAGLFDLIIGSFASLILLAPFIIAGSEWFSFKGFLTYAVVCSVVMFAYLTITVGMFGKTLGMRIFSLELIDIEENDYPTFHQAAVNSAIYLLSLIFGGIGFLTIPFNDEKRAVHDLVSGTIVVKEY